MRPATKPLGIALPPGGRSLSHRSLLFAEQMRLARLGPSLSARSQ